MITSVYQHEWKGRHRKKKKNQVKLGKKIKGSRKLRFTLQRLNMGTASLDTNKFLNHFFFLPFSPHFNFFFLRSSVLNQKAKCFSWIASRQKTVSTKTPFIFRVSYWFCFTSLLRFCSIFTADVKLTWTVLMSCWSKGAEGNKKLNYW